MRTKFLKTLSLLLAISIMLLSGSVVSVASDFSKLVVVGGTVELDGTGGGTVAVSLVVESDLVCYGIEGNWDTKEQGTSEYFKLTGISSDVLTFDENSGNYVYVKTGKVMWVDDLFAAETTAKGVNLLTATYSVAANTPEGNYTVRFVSDVFTDGDGIPDETSKVYTATIKVTHAAPAKVPGQAETCESDGWNDYYTCPVCGKYYSDAAGKNEITDLEAWKVGDGKIPATGHEWSTPKYTDNNDGTHTASYVCENDNTHTKSDDAVAHDFTTGDCACGAKEPVTGLKGDVDLNGEVDMDDVVALAQHVLQDKIITDSTALLNGEVTGDETLDMDDVVKLMQYVLKDIDTLG